MFEHSIVERLARTEVGVQIQQGDFAYDVAGLQRKRGTRADQTAAADDAAMEGEEDAQEVPMEDIPVTQEDAWAVIR